MIKWLGDEIIQHLPKEIYYNSEQHDFCQQNSTTPGIGLGTAHKTVLWSTGTPAMTTHGSANLWDTEDKVKLKTD
jgi:hypothetical protein